MTGNGQEARPNCDAMKRLMEKILLEGNRENVHDLFNNVVSQCREQSIPYNGAAALEYWWHLARLGVVAVPGAELGAISALRPRLLLTERGRRLLERDEQSPHDPPKYLAAVRKRVESPDDIVMTYLDEAVGAWAVDLNRASAVMWGCACEKLVLLLAEEIVKAKVQPWSAKINAELQSKQVRISNVFDQVYKCLTHLAEDKTLPPDLADALDRKLSAVFDHARGLRNKSGHPTGTDISSEDAEAGLLMFPGFYALVDGLCKHLKRSGVSGLGVADETDK